jgi:hypothetical protein
MAHHLSHADTSEMGRGDELELDLFVHYSSFNPFKFRCLLLCYAYYVYVNKEKIKWRNEPTNQNVAIYGARSAASGGLAALSRSRQLQGRSRADCRSVTVSPISWGR